MKLKELLAVVDTGCTDYIEVSDGTKRIEPEDAYDMEVVDFAPTSYEEYDLDSGHSLWTNNGIEITVKR
jgi:hypothetical protein